MTDLPIDAVLPELLAALRAQSNAVLVAPPGAGKTTAIAPALIAEPWCTGQVLLLAPRRLAARAAAERMAVLAGEPVGRTFGYATRLDSRQSAATRVVVQTQGVFLNRIQDDPELTGVSAVLFDEVHERSLDSDFALALALDAQAALRPELRLLAMSATLDGARFSALMGDAAVIESEGRAYPLTIHHIGRAADTRIEDAMAAAIKRAWTEEDGGILAFLPGVAEIERTTERLGDVPLHTLHGALDPAAQRSAIAPSPARKVVLATAIAETSVTIDGVSVVIDSGAARRPRYDRAAGLTRLVTERVSQAAATQRAGRAARQGPGIAIRLWEAAATAGLPRFDPPEIVEADLSPLLLACAIWGESDPRRLRWLDPPGEAALAEARARLTELGAIDADGRPTEHGRAIAALPLPPRLAHMLIEAARGGFADVASEVAMLLSERGLGGNDVDLEARLSRWRGERGQRAETARGMAKRWLSLLPSRLRVGSTCEATGGVSALSTIAPTPALRDNPLGSGRGAVGAAVALAFPDRVARRRSADGADWLSVGGRGFRLDPLSPLARAEWLAVAEAQGAASGARILAAAALEPAEIETLFGDRIAIERRVRFLPESGSVQATRERRLGAIRLASGPDERAEPGSIEAALREGVRVHGLTVLRFADDARALRARAAFLGEPDLGDAALLARLDDWLPVVGRRRLPEIDAAALEAMLDWPQRQALAARAPSVFRSPAGSTHPIDYAAEGGPRVELRVQALFGSAAHPTVAGVPLVLSLTSPAGRPIQTTRDLPGFWAGSWAAVAKEMRGRYPKHNWPENPAAAPATLKTKRAVERERARD